MSNEVAATEAFQPAFEGTEVTPETHDTTGALFTPETGKRGVLSAFDGKVLLVMQPASDGTIDINMALRKE